MRPFQFDLGTIPYNDLCGIVHWTTTRWRTFPAFVPWLADLLATEKLIRDGDLPRGDGNHYLPAHWTDADVADALEGSTAISFAENIDPATGKFLDKLTIHVAALAAGRLRDRDYIGKSIKGN